MNIDRLDDSQQQKKSPDSLPPISSYRYSPNIADKEALLTFMSKNRFRLS
jgi:hypothetical protein